MKDVLILLVEDDPRKASQLIRSLARSGMPPLLRTLPSAESAMEYLGGAGEYRDRVRYPLPSLIVSDIDLPGRSGTELLAWIRERDELKDVECVLYSAETRLVDFLSAALARASA